MSSIFCALAVIFCTDGTPALEHSAYENAHAQALTKRSPAKPSRKPPVKDNTPKSSDGETVIATTHYKCVPVTCWSDQGLGVTQPCGEGISYAGMTGMELALEDRQITAQLDALKAAVKVVDKDEYTELDAQAYVPEIAKPPIWQPLLVFGAVLGMSACVIRYSYHQSRDMGGFREN